MATLVKKKYRQARTNIKILEGKVRVQQGTIELLRRNVRTAEDARDRAEHGLARVERGIKECVGAHAAVLGVQPVEMSHDPGEQMRTRTLPKFRAFIENNLTHIPVAERILYRLEVQDITEAIDVLAFRLVDTSRNVQTIGKFPITHFVSKGWQNVSSAREEIALNIARGLVERMK